jgi:hypothetical protein
MNELGPYDPMPAMSSASVPIQCHRKSRMKPAARDQGCWVPAPGGIGMVIGAWWPMRPCGLTGYLP